MSQIEQRYYELLTRIDHPVFKKDFSLTTTKDSPLNSIFNRIFARQLVKLKISIDQMAQNSFPHLVDATSIDAWELEYFGFVKAGQPLADRVAQLLIKYNNALKMNVASAVYLAQSITGQTPVVLRSLAQTGWTLDRDALDVSTIFQGSYIAGDVDTYILSFSNPVNSDLIAILDNELTKIEKGGSRHVILTQPDVWTLDNSSLDINSRLG